MKLKLDGVAGEDVKFALAVTPAGGATVVKGSGPAAELFDVDANPQMVGSVPITAVFTVHFDFRPWEFKAELLIGGSSAVADTGSEALGLANGVLIRPDTLRLTIEATEKPGGDNE